MGAVEEKAKSRCREHTGFSVFAIVTTESTVVPSHLG